MSNELPHPERRHFSRIPMDCEVRLRCGGNEWQSRLIDLSLKGALLQYPSGFPRETSVECRLQLVLAGGGVTITMEGHTVHNGGEKIGFHCNHIDIDSIGHLRRMVALNLGDEAILERELNELLAVNGN